MVSAAQAADPTSGTVSDSSTTVSWTAGPFAAPNVTGAAGDPVCDASTCDDFALHVSTPAGYGSAHQLSISIEWANSAADFDLYVLDAAGEVVGTSASSADPELVLLPPDSGDYTVRVVPLPAAGGVLHRHRGAHATPPNPAPADLPAPAYSTYAAPESLPAAHDAGEPSIGVNPETGARHVPVVHVDLQGRLRRREHRRRGPTAARARPTAARSTASRASTRSSSPTSRPAGRSSRSWPARPRSPASPTTTARPGTPPPARGINSGVDHQTIGGGRFADDPLVGPVGDYPNAVYYCSQDIADALCATSVDGGRTYGPAVPVYDLTQCGGLHGHVKVDPSSGIAYLPNKGCGGGQAVAVSEDSGLTWEVRPVTGSTPGDSDPSVGIGSNGTVYFGYQAADGHARVATSHDHGQTWVDGQDVGAQLGVQNVVFPAMVAGDDDRAAFAFLGSTTGGNYQDADNFHGDWHLYIATTIDGGKSWKTADATPTDPVQRGSICTGGTTCGEDRNLLDFMDITVDGEGRALVGFADGCTGACAAPGGAQNFDALATIARQTAGPRLFAAFDAQPDLTVAPPTATRNGKTVTLSAVVTNRGGAEARGVTVAFGCGSKTFATSQPVTLAPGRAPR